jgi:hypothetical protein
MLDCIPQPSWTSPALGWSVIAVKLSGGGGGLAGWRCGQTFDENTYVKKYVKSSFFEVMSEAQKDLEVVSEGINIFKK